MKPLLSACLLLLPGLLGAQGLRTERFNGVNTIQLSTGSGDAVFVRGSGDDVELRLEYTYSDNIFRPKIRQNGTILVLEEDFASRPLSGARGSSTWTLTIPMGMEVRVSTGSGDVSVSDLDITLGISTGSGDASLSRSSGSVRHSSGSGDLDIAGFTGSIRSATGSGDVSIKRSTGEISAATGSGDVDITDHTGSLSAATGSGDVSASALSANGLVKLATGSGDISVSLASEINNAISLASGSGSSTLRLNGNPILGELTVQTGRNSRVTTSFEFDSIQDINRGGNRYKEYVKRFGSSPHAVNISTGSGYVLIRD